MTGDQGDMLARLKAVLPGRWFPDATPVLDGILSGLANAWAAVYSLWSFVALQTRILTATGVFLDMISYDFFGRTLSRRSGEADGFFRDRILASIFRPAVTRAAVSEALSVLTGRPPIIVEPWNNGDCGSYAAAGGSVYGGNIAYNAAGYWGSFATPDQFFIQAFQPNAGGLTHIGGYYYGSGWAGGGYGVGAIEYTNPDMNPGQVSDADIYATVALIKLEGTIGWVSISS